MAGEHHSQEAEAEEPHLGQAVVEEHHSLEEEEEGRRLDREAEVAHRSPEVVVVVVPRHLPGEEEEEPVPQPVPVVLRFELGERQEQPLQQQEELHSEFHRLDRVSFRIWYLYVIINTNLVPCYCCRGQTIHCQRPTSVQSF